MNETNIDFTYIKIDTNAHSYLAFVYGRQFSTFDGTRTLYPRRHIYVIIMFSVSFTYMQFESAHEETYNKTYATSEDSDQTAHPRSLIRVFSDRMCLLQPTCYPKIDERKLLPYTVDVQTDLNLCWSRRSYCRFCRALTQILYTFTF